MITLLIIAGIIITIFGICFLSTVLVKTIKIVLSLFNIGYNWFSLQFIIYIIFVILLFFSIVGTIDLLINLIQILVK